MQLLLGQPNDRAELYPPAQHTQLHRHGWDAAPSMVGVLSTYRGKKLKHQQYTHLKPSQCSCDSSQYHNVCENQVCYRNRVQGTFTRWPLWTTALLEGRKLHLELSQYEEKTKQTITWKWSELHFKIWDRSEKKIFGLQAVTCWGWVGAEHLQCSYCGSFN